MGTGGIASTRNAVAICSRSLKLSTFALASLVVLVAGQLSAARAHGVFHIFSPMVEEGAWDAEALSAFQFGLAANAAHSGQDPHDHQDGTDAHDHDAARAAHEFAIHGGVTSFWMTKLALSAEKAAGESYELSSVALENVFRLPRSNPGPGDWGWFTAVRAGVNSSETNTVEFGPIVSLSSGPVTLTLNPFFAKTFGRNREDGVAFSYGWRATYEIHERLSLGLEGYGEIEDIASAPEVSEQVHRVGPVLYIGHVHGTPHHHDENETGHLGQTHGGHEDGLHAEIGVLFGVTQATPDAALKVNLGMDF
ncbi:MAG TPA: hypothetical protein PKD49_02235 [Hyphomicrobium sp.]|nr:hypothetical protein [Hyphomicrobium sp.]